MEENKLSDFISAKKEQMEIEKVVSEKIVSYFNEKNDILKDDADAVDKRREKKVAEIEEERNQIEEMKNEAEIEMGNVKIKVLKEQEEKRKRDDKEKEEEERELQKIREKQAMDKAAKYIQGRWAWYQVEGKLLAKKRKKGGKGKGKKKKK